MRVFGDQYCVGKTKISGGSKGLLALLLGSTIGLVVFHPQKWSHLQTVMHSNYMYMLVVAPAMCVYVRRLLGVMGRERNRTSSGATSWPPPQCPRAQGGRIERQLLLTYNFFIINWLRIVYLCPINIRAVIVSISALPLPYCKDQDK